MKYYCDSCDFETDDSSNFKRHNASKRHLLKSEGESTLKTHQCEECEYSTQHKGNYNKHIKIHQGNTRYKYKCLACDINIADNTALHKHFRNLEHGGKVREKYPETVKLKKGFHIRNCPLDLSKRGEYIKNIDDTDYVEVKIEPKKRKEDKQLMKKDILPYYKLDEDEMEIIVNKFLQILKDNDIDPTDEGIYETDNIQEQYISIYNLIYDDKGVLDTYLEDTYDIVLA